MVKQISNNSLKVKKFKKTNKQMNTVPTKRNKNRKINSNVKNPKKTKTEDVVDLDFDNLEKAYDEFDDEDFQEEDEDDEEGELDLGAEGTFEDINDEEGEIDDEEEDDVSEEEDEDEEYEGSEEEETTEKEESKKSKKGSSKQQSLKKLEENLLLNSKAVAAFKKIQDALNSAVESIEGDDSKEIKKKKCNVQEPAVFNSIVRICLTSVPPALHRLLELKTLSDRPTKNKKWKKLSPSIKKYLKNIVLLVKFISEPSLIEKILKLGILPMLPFFHEFSELSWKLTKQIATFWCTSEEKIRVLSVIALFRLISRFKEERKEKVLKLLYVSYVRNCKFTSPTTLPMIDFMRMSLAELYNVDQAIAYRHGFIYIRQLASHLRNAMLIQKKDRMQLVYNWQFVRCLHFWSELLWKTHPSEILGPLIYPVVQICHGVLTFNKSRAYFPLTFHIVNMLSDLSQKTDKFIPVLPYLMEILSSPKPKAKCVKSSMKPIEWNCIIKVSKSQLSDSAFYEGLIDQLFNSSLNYLSTQCHTIGFPELVFPFVLQLKHFLKKCKVAAHSKKIKKLLDKISENSEFISDRRKDVTFKLTDSEAIRLWEIEADQVPPPLRSFCKQWNILATKLRDNEEMYSESAKDEFSISSLRKRQRDDQDDLEEDILKPKKKKQNSDESSEKPLMKNKKKKLENSSDVQISKKEEEVNDNKAEVEEKQEASVKGKITYFDSDDDFEEDVVKEMKL